MTPNTADAPSGQLRPHLGWILQLCVLVHDQPNGTPRMAFPCHLSPPACSQTFKTCPTAVKGLHGKVMHH